MNLCMSEILQTLLTYFVSLIITEHIRFMKNLQSKTMIWYKFGKKCKKDVMEID